jgi:hypothetical protein
MNISMSDAPRWDDAKAIASEREADHLKPGDAIQQWETRIGDDRRVSWYWQDGDVLAVVDKPCGGEGAPAWVALIQWCDGDNVTGWDAIPQHEWIHRSVLLRRKR